jgi:hypothetical protein
MSAQRQLPGFDDIMPDLMLSNEAGVISFQLSRRRVSFC